MGKTVFITSAKGGSGKTTIAASLGLSLANFGKKVCLVDLCFTARSLDMLLSLQDQAVFDIADLAEGACSPKDAVTVQEKLNLTLLPAPAASAEISAEDLKKVFKILIYKYDYVIADLNDPYSETVRPLLESADSILLLSIMGDEAARSTERLAGYLRETTSSQLSLAINKYDRRAQKILAVTPQAQSEYIDIPLIGIVPFDESVLYAYWSHSLPDSYDESVLRAVDEMAENLINGTALDQKKKRRLPWNFLKAK